MSSLPPTRSWSVTRGRMFVECERRYYYRYLFAPLGRRPGAPPAAVEANRLKDLVSVEMWSGQIVHDLIERLLQRWRRGSDLPEDEALSIATGVLSRQFKSSQEYWTSHPEAYKEPPLLLDLHYYHDVVFDRQRAGELKERVRASLSSFVRSEVAAEIRRVGPDHWRPIDRFARTRLEDGLEVLVKPDFAYEDGEILTILDWKTGRPEPLWAQVQLTCYAIYASECWQRDLRRIVPRAAYLYPDFALDTVECDEDRLRQVKEFVRANLDAILEKQEGVVGLPPIERYAVAADCRTCSRCSFRGICEGAKRLAPAPDAPDAPDS